jgi:hypothetical protein
MVFLSGFYHVRIAGLDVVVFLNTDDRSCVLYILLCLEAFVIFKNVHFEKSGHFYDGSNYEDDDDDVFNLYSTE